MTLALPRAELTDTSLTMPADASFEEWTEQGARLFTMERAVMWWIGDWWRFGEHQYGEQASQAVEIGYSAGTVSNAAAVASRIEMPRRRGDLSFGHHQSVAYLAVEDQDYWLTAAETGEWSVHELRTRVKLGRAPDDEPIPYRTAQDVDAEVQAGELVSHVEAVDALRDSLAVTDAHSHLHVRSRAAFARRLRAVGTYLGHIALEIEQEDSNGGSAAA